jgi:hypothetical protein
LRYRRKNYGKRRRSLKNAPMEGDSGGSTTMDTTKTLTLMLRKLSADKTLVFVLTVETEKNEADEGFVSIIAELEPGTLIATGDTPDASRKAAIEMFQEMADFAIEKNDLKPLIGSAEIMQELSGPIARIMKAVNVAFNALEQRSREQISAPAQEQDRWLSANNPELSGAAA